MAKLVSLLISERQQRLLAFSFGFVIFALFVSLGTMLALHEVGARMTAEGRNALDQFVRVRTNLDSTFVALGKTVTAIPCTPEFQSQLRRVAYIPDGFSEFLYAPDGIVQCALGISRLETAHRLGRPDIGPDPASRSPAAMWIDHNLGFLGLSGLVGSIVAQGDLAIVVPPQKLGVSVPSWLRLEVVIAGPDIRWWHRGGEVGLYERYLTSGGTRAQVFDTTLRNLACDGSFRYCVATEASMADILATNKTYVALSLLATVLLAAWLALLAKAFIVRYWSFEARFRRHLDAASIVCAYQPLMDLRSGRIVGCEVLARWRDVDDAIVYPDRFIALVERYGLTAKFTRLVVERACRELSDTMAPDERLQITFNIFPRDLDSVLLRTIFKVFDTVPGRFDLVVELVESDAIVVETAQREIEALRQAGIRTYIDDFGTGYSNIQNLAALSVDGVKLDRAFAMAPEGSMMARMLGHAIEMIHASGRAIVVEGVETEERLQLLRRILPPIDFVQGYHISRPLDIRSFAAFLASRRAAMGLIHLAELGPRRPTYAAAALTGRG